MKFTTKQTRRGVIHIIESGQILCSALTRGAYWIVRDAGNDVTEALVAATDRAENFDGWVCPVCLKAAQRMAVDAAPAPVEPAAKPKFAPIHNGDPAKPVRAHSFAWKINGRHQSVTSDIYQPHTLKDGRLMNVNEARSVMTHECAKAGLDFTAASAVMDTFSMVIVHNA